MKLHTKGNSRLLILLATIGLTACGGGGGSDNSDSSPDNNGTSNTAPVILGSSSDYVRSGSPYAFEPFVFDAENDSLLFTVENAPDWLAFDPSTGRLSGVPDDRHIRQYDDIVVSVSDGRNTASLAPFSIKVLFEAVGEQNVQIDNDAQVTPTPDGYELVGNASITVGSLTTDLGNAALRFEYDAEGHLVNLEGESDLPSNISDNLSLQSQVRTTVGMMTGAEINASLDIGPDSTPGILLRDEFRYLVYFFNSSADLAFSASDGSEEPITLGLAGTTTLVISDPTDPFFYYFGSVSGTAAGFGYSYNSNIPYRPLFEPTGATAFEPLEPFLGQAILKGSFPISAFRVFDVFELSGTAVCRPAQLVSCDKPSATGLVTGLATALIVDGGIDSTQQIKLGLNGSSSLKFAVLGIDLFEYHLLDVAAMIEVGTRRNHLALQGVFESGTSKSPDWLPIKPVPDPGALMVANLFADADTQTGSGDFGISLYGGIDSSFPLARMEGEIAINPRGMQMTGLIDDPTNPINVHAVVDADKLEAGIEFGYDIQGNIDPLVNGALDRALADAEQAFNDLETAIGDYEFALSLEGFRSRIPAIVDSAIAILSSLPDSIHQSVLNGTLSGIRSSCVTIVSRVCADSILDEDAVARSAANSARSTAQSNVNARIAELNELKAQAAEIEDGPAFRTALKNALLDVVARGTSYSQSVRVTRTVDFGVTSRTFTFYDNTLSYPVISSTTRSQLQTAADNVDNIGPRQSIMFSTQAIYDEIPKEAIIEETRSGIRNGTTRIPEFRGAGYTVTRTLEQSAYVQLGEERIEIGFNPLDPVTVVENISELIVDLLLR